jgi:hypothetical protein
MIGYRNYNAHRLAVERQTGALHNLFPLLMTWVTLSFVGE